MPQTYRDYPVYDIAVVAFSNARTDGGMIRYQAGDIVAAVVGLECVGVRACHGFLWLRLQGWDSSLMDRLTDPITDKSQADPLFIDEIAPSVTYEKARFCIPLESMRRILPSFSVERATNPADIYQPFMNIDEGAIANFATTHLTVSVDPVIWLPRLIEEPDVLAAALANLTDDSTLVIERTITEPEFAEAALDAGYFLITHPPIDPDGFIFDKFTQTYLYG